jgi:hypothetical protein
MSKVSINYLFPPDQINNLDSWRFILHFKLLNEFRQANLIQVTEKLKNVQWEIIDFPFGLDNLIASDESQTVSIPIEVTEENRSRINALTDYESDFWKVCGNMMENGFGDVYYEAVDWQEYEN